MAMISLTSSQHIYSFPSPIGKIKVVCDEHFLYELSFLDSEESVSSPYEFASVSLPILTKIEQELNEYFDGKRREFSIPLHFSGTPFQMKVWEILIGIPYGTTTTYNNLTQQIGHPKASRAVGNALGKNKIAILIPCHRVITSQDGIGGYAYGIERKQFLLSLEKHYLL